jgi:hypothetical protein
VRDQQLEQVLHGPLMRSGAVVVSTVDSDLPVLGLYFESVPICFGAEAESAE